VNSFSNSVLKPGWLATRATAADAVRERVADLSAHAFGPRVRACPPDPDLSCSPLLDEPARGVRA
jgi:hypothetical protein